MIEFIIGNLLTFAILFFLMFLLVSISFLGVYYLLKKMAFIAEQVLFILEYIEEYGKHLESLNTADKFFGEPSIVRLIEHTNYLINKIKTFLEVFEFMNTGEIIDAEEPDEDNEENYEKENH